MHAQTLANAKAAYAELGSCYVADMTSYDRQENHVFLVGTFEFAPSFVRAVFERKADIFNFFSANPDLLQWPYDLQSGTRTIVEFDEEAFNEDSFEIETDWTTGEDVIKKVEIDRSDYEHKFEEDFEFIRGDVSENLVWRFIQILEIREFDTISSNPRRSWSKVEFPDVDNADFQRGAYSAVDTLMYFFHLMNACSSTLPQLATAYDANVTTDAIGRPNVSAAKQKLMKLIERFFGYENWIVVDPDHVISFIEFSRSEIRQSTRSNGLEFEKLCSSALSLAGYEVSETRRSGDFGADLIAEIAEVRFAIQCKDTGKPAGVKAIQEASGAQKHYITDYAVVCSKSGFTGAAVELAATTGVILTSLEEIVRVLSRV